MRTVCNFEVGMSALRDQVGELAAMAMRVHPVPHTAELVTTAALTLHHAINQMLGEHRHIAHSDAGDDHGKAVDEAAKVLAENILSAKEAFFHDDTPPDDTGDVPPFVVEGAD